MQRDRERAAQPRGRAVDRRVHCVYRLRLPDCPDYFEEACRYCTSAPMPPVRIRARRTLSLDPESLVPAPRSGEGWHRELHRVRQPGHQTPGFAAVGGFDEKMVSCEDNDLGLRLNRAGFKVYQAHSIRALHPGGEQSLRVFFRKTAWRSMGMFQMMKHSWMNKPLVITLAHFVLVARGPGQPFRWVRVPARAHHGFAGAGQPGSGLYHSFYAARVKRLYAPFRSMLLYHLWFWRGFMRSPLMLASWALRKKRKVAIGARLHSPAHTPE